MSKKGIRPVTLAPLQRVVAEPITDPAEQAVLDRARKRAKGKRPAQPVKPSGRRATEKRSSS